CALPDRYHVGPFEIGGQNIVDRFPAPGAGGRADLTESHAVTEPGAREHVGVTGPRDLELGALHGAIAERLVENRPQVLAAQDMPLVAAHRDGRGAAAHVALHDVDSLEPASDATAAVAIERFTQLRERRGEAPRPVNQRGLIVDLRLQVGHRWAAPY